MTSLFDAGYGSPRHNDRYGSPVRVVLKHQKVTRLMPQKNTRPRKNFDKSDATSPSYRVDDQIGFILRLAFQFHTAIFTARMVDNITQTQFAALSKIYEMGECSQSDLVRLIGLDSATINGVISRMVARGFLKTSEDPSDGRRQFVSLTAEGRDLVERAQTVGREISVETLSALSATERDRLIQLLRKMMEAPRHNRWLQYSPDPAEPTSGKRGASSSRSAARSRERPRK
jgi:DNA-binding MarR family transcriptional regulator